MSWLLRLLHVVQIAIACHAGQQSSIAIQHLRKYEGKMKKLSKWSSAAERRLNETRTTQMAAVIAEIITIVVALVLIFQRSNSGLLERYLSSPIMAVAVFVTVSYMRRTWVKGNGTTVGRRVPLPKMQAYNEGQRRTEGILEALEWLMYSWAASSVLAVVVGY